MLNNKNFYPTPKPLIRKMLAKVQGTPKKVLEPSAGKGDIVEYCQGKWGNSRYSNNYKLDISAIEIDQTLQATLRGKEIKLLDGDFLTYCGPDQFDLIVANPPFDNGEKHLLKAIDIMYRGQIVFLLNAETLRNPNNMARQELVKRLGELNADIEFSQGEFIDAERKTNVEIAMIYINIERSLEDDLFEGAKDKAEDIVLEENKAENEISTRKTIEELVLCYQRSIKVNTELIMDYCRTRNITWDYLTLSFGKGDDSERFTDITAIAQHQVNGVVDLIRKKYWRKVLDLKEVKSRMTEKKLSEFEEQISIQCKMEFTESNVRQFILNLVHSYTDVLTDTVVEVFETMTKKYMWEESIHCKNVHYFNGWKTNDAFKVNKKVIIPVYPSYGSAFVGYSGWQLDYKVGRELHDIDLVMNYFDARAEFESLDDAIKRVFAEGDNKGESTYFKFICYKKGTIHLTFKDEDIRRRFNVTACRGKAWLPEDYGAKPLSQLTFEERSVVEQFEEKVSDYTRNQGQPMFAAKSMLQIAV